MHSQKPIIMVIYLSITWENNLQNTKIFIEMTARHQDRLAGPYFTYGITIRSASETAWALQNLPAQHQYPRILATLFLFVFSLVGLAMSFSTPKYADVWAYSAFCGSLAVLVWKETPFFWGEKTVWSKK